MISYGNNHDDSPLTPQSHVMHMQVRSVVFSPDGRSIASGSDDMTVRVWDVSTGKEVRRLEGHTEAVSEREQGVGMVIDDWKGCTEGVSDKER